MEEICYIGLEENIIKLDILSEICPVYANVALIIIQTLLYYTYFDPFRKASLFSHWHEQVDCSNRVESETKVDTFHIMCDPESFIRGDLTLTTCVIIIRIHIPLSAVHHQPI